MKTKILQRTWGALVILLFIIVSPTVSFADNDTFMIDNVEGSLQNEVTIKGEPNVIYCMQQNYLWPVYNTPGYANSPTKYRSSTDGESLLTRDQEEILRKVVFAGYPYNGKLYLDPLYDTYGEFADSFASNITQAIIWNYMSKWEIPGNPEYNGPLVSLDGIDITEPIIANIMAYAESDALVSPPASTDIEIKGSGEMREVNGIWKTDKLSIVNPSGCDLTYSLKLPDGIKAMDGQNHNISTIDGDEFFYLISDDKNNLSDNVIINIESRLSFPGEMLKQFIPVTTADVVVSEKNEYQTMLAAGILSVDFNGKFPVYIKESATDDSESHGNSHSHKTELSNNADKDFAVDTSDRAPILVIAYVILASVLGIVMLLHNHIINK